MGGDVAGPRARRSLFVWGWYLAILGVGLLLWPNPVLTLVRLPETDEVWIRVVAMFVLLLAHFSFSSARTANAEYMRWSVQARLAVPFFFAAFVLADWVSAALIPFGLVDLAGAMWTWGALRRDAAAG
jgi:hypothetical protein